MDYQLKLDIMNEIQNHVDVFYSAGIHERVIRCPICGDSQKNLRKGHCYIKISEDPTEPLLWNCFKCNKSGIVNRNFFKALGINSPLMDKADKSKYNRLPSLSKVDINVLTGTPDLNSPGIKYLESRLGKGFTLDDYDRFKIVWDTQSLLPYISNQKTRNSLPNSFNTINFLSDDKMVLLSRSLVDVEGHHDLAWRKIEIMHKRNKAFYTIKVMLDLFTKDNIIVNIAEGVMDVISIYKNFNDGNNSVFIGSLGSDYISAIEYSIMKGFIGSNIIMKIYIDNDIDINKLKKQLNSYKWLFGKISIYMNIKSKDVGTTIDNIQLVEYNI